MKSRGRVPEVLHSDYRAIAAHATDFFRAYEGTGEFSFHERPSLGLVVAAGFHGKGVMTAPVTATLVRELVSEEVGGVATESRSDVRRDPFLLGRFDSRSPDFEFFEIGSRDDGDDGDDVA